MSTIRVNNMTNIGGDGPTYAKGHVINMQSFIVSSDVSTTSTSLTDSGVSISYTPKNAASTLIITYVGTCTAYSASATVVGGQVAITDSGNTVLTHNRVVDYQGTGMERAIDWPCVLTATTPASTTNSRTYKIRYQSDGSGTFGLRGSAGTPYYPIITVQEIAG